MSVTGRQSIVSLFSQGNVFPALIITAVAVLFYYNGLQVYIHGENLWDLPEIEKVRNNFYVSSTAMRPVAHVTQDLIRFIFGLDNPLPFHAVVLGLHVANSILVFIILKKVVGTWVGIFGALLFTSFFAHPDVVAYHHGISEALRAFFCLSFFILFYRYKENPNKTNYVLTLGAFILAIGSKESTPIILPPLMYLVHRYLQMESKDRGGDKQNNSYIPYIPYIPFIMIPAALLPLIVMAAKKFNAFFNWTEYPINLYLSAITSFNLCSLKGPGCGTSFLILSLLLSFLPIFDLRTKRCLILLWVGWLVTIIPLISLGMDPRHLYITSAFSMAIFAICVYHLIAYVVGRFGLKEAYVTFLTILAVSVLVTTNFLYVSRHVKYLKDSGRVVESLCKLILTDFPKGTLGTKLVFINLPGSYEPTPGSGCVCTRHVLWHGLIHLFVAVYGERNVGPIYEYGVSELYNGRHPLKDAPRLSPQELEKLAMEKNTRVYLFNPRNDTILDATGKDYNSLKKLVSNN